MPPVCFSRQCIQAMIFLFKGIDIGCFIAGYTDESLSQCPRFDAKLAAKIKKFICGYPGQKCLIAHDGYRYVLPMLNKELKLAGVVIDDNELVCVCSTRLVSALQQRYENPKNHLASDISKAIVDAKVNDSNCYSSCTKS